MPLVVVGLSGAPCLWPDLLRRRPGFRYPVPASAVGLFASLSRLARLSEWFLKRPVFCFQRALLAPLPTI
jgi:hypothetical protein